MSAWLRLFPLKKGLKIDYLKAALTFVVLTWGIYFSLNAPLNPTPVVLNNTAATTTFFDPKFVGQQREAAKFGLISQQESKVRFAYGIVSSRQKEASSHGLIAQKEADTNLLNNHEWAAQMRERLEKKWGQDRQVTIKLHEDFCYAELYKGQHLEALYTENMLHNNVQGYAGPIFLGMYIAPGGEIQGIDYIESIETESYLRKIFQTSYLEQYQDLSYGDAHEIDAVSGATITTKAMADATTDLLHQAAPMWRAYLSESTSDFNIKALLGYRWIFQAVLIGLLFMIHFQKWYKFTKKGRLIYGCITLLFLGFINNQSFTYISILQPFIGTKLSMFMVIYTSMVVLSAIWGKNTYCKYVCPFGAAQMIALRFSPFKSKKIMISNRQLAAIRYALTLAILTGIIYGFRGWSNFELFPDLFGYQLQNYWFFVAALVIAISMRYPMIWCRMTCPTGCILDTVSDLSERKWAKKSSRGKLPKRTLVHQPAFKKAMAIGVLLFSHLAVDAQVFKILVADNENATPIAGASILIKNTESGQQQLLTTNRDGEARFNYQEGLTATVHHLCYIDQQVKLKKANLRCQLAPDVRSLQQVVVTAQGTPKPVDQSVYKVKLIASPEITKMGAAQLPDLLHFQSGINLFEDPMLGTKIMMQGLGGEHVNVMIDGVPLIGRQDGNIDLSQINLSEIEQIEIIEGPMSVIYGSNALAGTINIISKKHERNKLDIGVRSFAESVGQFQNSLDLNYKSGNHLMGIATSYNYFNGYNSTSEGQRRSHDWRPKTQFQYSPYYQFKNHKIDFKIGLRNFDETISALGDFPAFGSTVYDIQFLTKRYNLYQNLKLNIGEKASLTGLTSYQIFDRNTQHLTKDLINNDEVVTGETSDHFNTLLSRWIFVQNWDRIQLQIGGEYKQDEGSGDKVPENDGLTEVALFSSAEIKLTDQHTLQPGLRYMHNSKFDAPVIYNLHYRWQGAQHWSGRLSMATAFRSPSLKELYMTFVDSNHQIYGNENLLAEEGFNVSAGLSKQVIAGDLQFRLEMNSYYNHLKNGIELMVIPNDDQQGQADYVYGNVQEKKTYGGHFSTKVNWQDQWQLSAEAQVANIGYYMPATGQMEFSPNYNFTLSTEFLWEKTGINTRLDFRYYGQFVQLIPATEEEDSYTQSVRDPYKIMNLTFSKSLWNNAMNLSGGVKNISNVNQINTSGNSGAHSSGPTMPVAWGRSYFISISYTFKSNKNDN